MRNYPELTKRNPPSLARVQRWMPNLVALAPKSRRRDTEVLRVVGSTEAKKIGQTNELVGTGWPLVFSFLARLESIQRHARQSGLPYHIPQTLSNLAPETPSVWSWGSLSSGCVVVILNNSSKRSRWVPKMFPQPTFSPDCSVLSLNVQVVILGDVMWKFTRVLHAVASLPTQPSMWGCFKAFI